MTSVPTYLETAGICGALLLAVLSPSLSASIAGAWAEASSAETSSVGSAFPPSARKASGDAVPTTTEPAASSGATEAATGGGLATAGAVLLLLPLPLLPFAATGTAPGAPALPPWLVWAPRSLVQGSLSWEASCPTWGEGESEVSRVSTPHVTPNSLSHARRLV